MPITVLQVPTDLLVADDLHYPDRDDAAVLEHLTHYCLHSDVLPAVTVLVSGPRPVVVSGHRYLYVAQRLERPTIRAVVDHRSDPHAVDQFLRLPNVVQLDPKVIDEQELRQPVHQQWHVFFFARPLTDAEKHQFEVQIADYFVGLAGRLFPRDETGSSRGPVHYDDVVALAEFEAATPVGAESWFGDYLSRVRSFATQVVPIVSYQGMRWIL